MNTTETQHVCNIARDYIFFKVGKDRIKYKLSQLYYFKGTDKGTLLFIKGLVNPVSVWAFLSEIEARLPKTRFVRCHDSYIINLDYVIKHTCDVGGYVVMDDDKTTITVSRTYRKHLLNILDDIHILSPTVTPLAKKA